MKQTNIFFDTFFSRAAISRVAIFVALMMGLTACSGGIIKNKTQGRQVAAGGIYKIGNPYQIDGAWFYPRENAKYDKQGIASWYGEKFHGRRTANGEIFDMDLLTAAHPTLPMPVRARVTNLENGKSIIVRINDRGPFLKDREIDLSRKAAEMLGYREQGTAQVRVQYLARAPLYDSQGRHIRGPAPERFTLTKATTPQNEKKIEAVPTKIVETRTLDGQPPPKKKPVFDLSNKRYAVQVGAFSSRQNAERLRQQLQRFEPVEIEEVAKPDAVLYRVKLGGVNIRADARATVEELWADGHADAIIIEQ